MCAECARMYPCGTCAFYSREVVSSTYTKGISSCPRMYTLHTLAMLYSEHSLDARCSKFDLIYRFDLHHELPLLCNNSFSPFRRLYLLNNSVRRRRLLKQNLRSPEASSRKRSILRNRSFYEKMLPSWRRNWTNSWLPLRYGKPSEKYK